MPDDPPPQTPPPGSPPPQPQRPAPPAHGRPAAPYPPGHAYPPPPRRQESASAMDALIPTNPMAAISCYMGILSMIICILGPLLGPGAIVLGVMGLKKWNVQESTYGKTTSTIRAWIGIVTGVLGTLIGIGVIVFLIMDANM